MLYDPKKWPYRAPVAAPLTREHILAWLETKPADERYYWSNSKICAAGQYIQQACGIGYQGSGWTPAWLSDPVLKLNDMAQRNRDRTFGSLHILARARWGM